MSSDDNGNDKDPGSRADMREDRAVEEPSGVRPEVISSGEEGEGEWQINPGC